MPSGRRDRILYRLSHALDMPDDVVLNLPRATLVGGLQLLLENHEGIVEYTPSVARVRTSEGEIVVSGRRLRIKSLVRQELLLEGEIHSVERRRGV